MPAQIKKMKRVKSQLRTNAHTRQQVFIFDALGSLYFVENSRNPKYDNFSMFTYPPSESYRWRNIRSKNRRSLPVVQASNRLMYGIVTAQLDSVVVWTGPYMGVGVSPSTRSQLLRASKNSQIWLTLSLTVAIFGMKRTFVVRLKSFNAWCSCWESHFHKCLTFN